MSTSYQVASFFVPELSLPPANEVCEGYVFTNVCRVRRGGGVCIQGVEDPRPLDTMGYGQRAGGTHPTEMHSCGTF